MNNYDLIPDLVTISSDKLNIPCSKFGSLDLHNSLGLFRNCEAVVNVTYRSDVSADSICSPHSNYMSFYRVKGNPGSQHVFFTRMFLGSRAILSLRYVDGSPIVESNTAYDLWSTMRITKEEPVGSLLSDLISLDLIRSGYLALHAACVASSNDSYLITAPPDTGKTFTTTKLIEAGLSYLSEDITVVSPSDCTAYSVPYTETLDQRRPASLLSPIQLFKSLLFGTITGRSYSKKDMVTGGYATKKSFCPNGNIKKIFILEYSRHQGLQKISATEAARKILLLNRFEFSHGSNNLIKAYRYFNPSSIDLESEFRERELINDLVKKVPVYVVYGETFDSFWSTINNEIQSTK